MPEAADSIEDPLPFWPTLRAALASPFRLSGGLTWGMFLPLVLVLIPVYLFEYIYHFEGGREESLLGFLGAFCELLVLVMVFASQAIWFNLMGAPIPVATERHIRLKIFPAFGSFLLLAIAARVPQIGFELVQPVLHIPSTVRIIDATDFVIWLDQIQGPSGIPDGGNTTEKFGALHFDDLMGWLVPTTLSVVITCFLTARLCVFFPASLFGDRRKSFRQCWADTKVHEWRITTLFLSVYSVTLVLRTALLFPIARSISSLGEQVTAAQLAILHTLANGIQVGCLWLLGGLWWASVGLAVYRQSVQQNLATNVSVFD